MPKGYESIHELPFVAKRSTRAANRSDSQERIFPAETTGLKSGAKKAARSRKATGRRGRKRKLSI
jgi:hypothetical protein